MNPINILFQENARPPQLEKILTPPIVDLTGNPNLTLTVDRRGTIYILSSDENGSFVMQTNMNKLYIATNNLADGCTARWGWKPPRGRGETGPFDSDAKIKLADELRKIVFNFEV